MYQVAMYYTVKTLLSQGKSIREISKELGMCRRAISKIKSALDNGQDRPSEQTTAKSLDTYKDLINEYYDEGLTALFIHRRLVQQKALTISYSSVA